MKVNLEQSWKDHLADEFDKSYFIDLLDFIDKEYKTSVCFPKESEVFAAFDYCNFNDVKVIIIGQDPYHGNGQAHGLSFSVPEGMPIPPSLSNIFKEISADVGESVISNGNLCHWAKQGVLLLNATLTVRSNQPGSHQKKGWEKFTDAVIKQISETKKEVVFLLWGGYAKKKGAKIDKNKHLILTSGHPSPLSANRGYWFGNKHFSQANDYLVATKQKPIQW